MNMTGSMGRPWVELEHPKPPRPQWDGGEHYRRMPGEEPSERALWWIRQLARGWNPPRRWTQECDDCRADLFGVHLWEQKELLNPIIEENARRAVRECVHVFRVQHVFSRGARDTFRRVCSLCGDYA